MLNIAEYRARPAILADYLPWACLVAPGVILNKDGSFQRTARYRGPDLGSTTPEGLVQATARINNLLRRFGSGWAIHFEARRREARSYPNSTFDCPVAWLVDEERRGQFEAAGEHFATETYLTLTYLPPSEASRKLSGLLIERSDEAKAAGPSYWDYLASFRTQTDRTFDLLADLCPEFAPLDDDETLTFLHGCVSTKGHPIRRPNVPAYLDAFLIDTPLTGGLAPTLGDRHLKTLTILGLPPHTEPGLLDALASLPFEHRWTTRFLPLDKAEATKELTRLRRQWFAKRKGVLALVKEAMTQEGSALVDTDADNKAADADEALQELGADYASYGYLTTSVVIADEDAARLSEKAKLVERALGGLGFATIDEDLNAVDAWLGSLPGHAYANVRRPLVSSLNASHLMPFGSIWAGPERNDHLGGPPLLIASTEGQTPFRLTTHVGDVGHTAIVGPTGAGKSVLLSLIALQFMRYEGAQVFAFDRGNSARATTLAMGGAHYRLGEDQGFQPLRAIDTPEGRTFAADWLRGLIEEQGLPVTPDIRDAVWTALGSLAGAPHEQRTMTGLVLTLQSSTLRDALRPYTIDGAYGWLFDADEDRFGGAGASVQCFETEALMEAPAVVPPALAYLFHKLEARFDGSPTLLILDEAWTFLDHPLFADRIKGWLKTLRKKNVSVVFATQSLADIESSPIASVIAESCPTRIFLPNERATEAQSLGAYRAFGLNDRQVQIVASATPKRHYYYQSPRGNRLFDLALGPVAFALCAVASPDDQRAIDRVLAHAGADGFAADWLAGRGLLWAADLLTDHFCLPATTEGASA
ncbi:conjugal transfer protein TrbE [Parvularcula oceani]|uniref:conjugal transfer protein TrbE n=1 Tax=Parvularcula oceani TaxID=1247963 RepID=UPI0004E25C2B|nr:conjugal transfer protein TrbE [Parvularcula oceani]